MQFKKSVITGKGCKKKKKKEISVQPTNTFEILVNIMSAQKLFFFDQLK